MSLYGSSAHGAVDGLVVIVDMQFLLPPENAETETNNENQRLVCGTGVFNELKTTHHRICS
jgi:hypothetical protein